MQLPSSFQDNLNEYISHERAKGLSDEEIIKAAHVVGVPEDNLRAAMAYHQRYVAISRNTRRFKFLYMGAIALACVTAVIMVAYVIPTSKKSAKLRQSVQSGTTSEVPAGKFTTAVTPIDPLVDDSNRSAWLVLKVSSPVSCKYSNSDESYDDMDNVMPAVDDSTLRATLTDLGVGEYTYFIRCLDADGVAMDSSIKQNFRVQLAVAPEPLPDQATPTPSPRVASAPASRSTARPTARPAARPVTPDPTSAPTPAPTAKPTPVPTPINPVTTNTWCTVDARLATDLAASAQTMASTCLSAYPKIEALLGKSKYKAPHKVVYDSVYPKDIALTSAGTVHLTISYFRQHPTDKGVLVHELSHVAQGYPATAPGWLTEGTADYVRWKLGYTPASYFKCTSTTRYNSGYQCTGVFLNYVVKKYPALTIPALSSTLRAGTYTDAYFKTKTGKSVSTLYADCRLADCKGGAK